VVTAVPVAVVGAEIQEAQEHRDKAMTVKTLIHLGVLEVAVALEKLPVLMG